MVSSSSLCHENQLTGSDSPSPHCTEDTGSPYLNLDFSSESISDAEAVTLWDALAPWLLENGYRRYHDMWGGMLYPQIEFTGVQEHPFGYIGQTISFQENAPLPRVIDGPQKEGSEGVMATFLRQFMYAQDANGRHVIIKPVQQDSDEFKIYERIYGDRSHLTDPDDFPCVIPVLDILRKQNYGFVVMPRWGQVTTRPWFNHIYEVLDVIHASLKGLAYLHQRRIFHRDIGFHNIIPNHFGPALDTSINEDNIVHVALRRDRRLRYAIIDFDLSLVLPETTSLTECRLPTHLTFAGTGIRPHGVLMGELDFNPFVYDVGCLGILFCDYFQHLTDEVPFLAPLMDGMINSDLTKRMSAAEALSFFETYRDMVPETILDSKPVDVLDIDPCSWKAYDRWSRLSPTLQQQWKAYRSNTPFWPSRMVEHMVSTSMTAVALVQKARKVHDRLLWIVSYISIKLWGR